MTITAKKIIETALETLDKEPQMMHGCYAELSNETYHAIKSHFSRSALMDFDRSPYNYWAKHVNPNRPQRDSTPAMQLGSAFHTLLLEPELFSANYTIEPLPVLLKEVGKEAYAAYKKACDELVSSNKIILSWKLWVTLNEMQSKFQENDQAMDLLKDARIENSFFWQDAESEMWVKARPDILHENMIIDLKTCSDASPRAFQSSMVMGGYHVQGAMIRDAVEAIEGRRINTVINICIETKYPYCMAIYILDEAAIDAGQVKYRSLLVDLKHAIGHNIFDDYGVQEIGLPKWAL